MEIPVIKSRLYFFIILLCSGAAAIACASASLKVGQKVFLLIVVVVLTGFEFMSWLRSPPRLSLRQNCLWVHSFGGGLIKADYEIVSNHVFWLSIPILSYSGSRKNGRIYIFRDSLTKADWCSLQRSVRRASAAALADS